jgi:hypothetical protein
MRGATFQNDRRADIRVVTSGVEPAARAEPAVQEQQRLIRKLANIDRATPPKQRGVRTLSDRMHELCTPGMGAQPYPSD